MTTHTACSTTAEVTPERQQELDAQLACLNEVLRGTIVLNPYERGDQEQRHIAYDSNDRRRLCLYLTGDDRDAEADRMPIEFNSDAGEWLDEHESVPAAVIAHLEWVIAEHQKNLAEVARRLRAAGLIE